MGVWQANAGLCGRDELSDGAPGSRTLSARRRRRNQGCVGRVGCSLTTARHLPTPRRLSGTDVTDGPSARLVSTEKQHSCAPFQPSETGSRPPPTRHKPKTPQHKSRCPRDQDALDSGITTGTGQASKYTPTLLGSSSGFDFSLTSLPFDFPKALSVSF